MQPLQSSLDLTLVDHKINHIETSVKAALAGDIHHVPDVPGRDAEVMALRDLPDKPGLSKVIGQARMLHDLANIELQAMELCLRTLIEFPNAPLAFRERLAEIAIDESEHLKLSVNGIRELGFDWGHWPVHLGLWRCVKSDDSLLDRVLMVHRFMEGSGLDAGETIQRRLSGAKASLAIEISKRIANDEVGHVLFGSDWYRKLCGLEKIDPAEDFEPRLKALFHRLPRRLEPIALTVRQAAGFTLGELGVLEAMRQKWLNPLERIHPVSSHFGT